MDIEQLLQEYERTRLAHLRILEDQKITEAKLRKSEAYNRLLFNSSPIGLALWKMDGTLVDVNPAYAKILGRTVEETLKLTYWDITPKKYEEQEKQQLKSLEETGSYGPYEKEYIHKDGHLVPVRLQGVIFEQEGERFILSSVEAITDLRRKEDELKNAYKKTIELETIINRSPAVAFLWRAAEGWPVDYVSENIALFGYTPAEFLSGTLPFAQIIYPDDLERVRKEVSHYSQTGATEFEQEYRIVTKSGEVRWVNNQTFVRCNQNNEITHYQGIVIDITEHKIAEEEVKKQKELFQKIVDYIPLMIASFDEKGKIQLVNHEIVRKLGWSLEEWQAENILEKCYPKPEDFKKALDFMINKPIGWKELKTTTKYGTVIDTIWTNILLPDGLSMGIGQDITESKRAEEEIRQTNEELRVINKIISTTASILDTKEMLDKVLIEALKIVGLEGGTVCTIEPDNTLNLVTQRESSDETICELTQKKIKVGDCLCGNCANENRPLILRDREAVLQYATREVLRGENINFHAAFPFVVKEKSVGVLCVFTRTDKKPAERSLKLLETLTAQVALAIENTKLYEEIKKHSLQLERLVSDRTAKLQYAIEELEAFSYSVSHDLRAPLRAIDGFSLALLEDYSDKLDKEGKHYLQRVRNAATEMALLIDDLLNLSRISRRELKRGNVDLSKIIISIKDKLIASEPGRIVKFTIEEDVRVEGDSNLLKIVMENLFSNAWKFTSKKKNAKIEFGILQKEGKTVYYIKDNGVGFDMRYADKLFSPFQRLHRKEDYPGTGIGLATVKRIILKHGGNIWAESEIEKGTTFYFTI